MASLHSGGAGVFINWDQRLSTSGAVAGGDSACGFAESASGPFYCPGDHKVYIDLAFYRELFVNRRESIFYVPPFAAIGNSVGVAAATALLLNLESVFTAGLAVLLFGERLGGRAVLGIAAEVLAGHIAAAKGEPLTAELQHVIEAYPRSEEARIAAVGEEPRAAQAARCRARSGAPSGTASRCLRGKACTGRRTPRNRSRTAAPGRAPCILCRRR